MPGPSPLLHATYMFPEKKANLGLPQPDVRFLTDSNSWNVNGTPNLRTVKQMLRELSKLASANILAQPGILFFSWVIRNQIFSFQVCGNVVEDNIMY